MATIVSAATGNFTATTTWVGGVVPTAADVAQVAAGHTVTINADVTVTEVTNNNTTGRFVLGNGRILTANVTGGAAGGTVDITATTTARINGNIANTLSTASTRAVVISGTGTVTLNGTITGGGTSGAVGVYSTVNTNTVVTGNIVGGGVAGAYGLHFLTATSPVLNVTGNLISGAAGRVRVEGTSAQVTINGSINGNSTDAGVSIPGTSATLTITGDLLPSTHAAVSTSAATTTVTGTVTGGTANAAHGLTAPGAGVVTINGNVTGGTNNGAAGVNANSTTVRVNVNGNMYADVGPALTLATLSLSGDIYASTSNAAISGVSCIVFLDGKAIDASNGRVPFAGCRVYLVDPPTAVEIKHLQGSVDIFGNITSGGQTTLIAVSEAGYPATGNVRQGTSYAAGTLTGTLAVPPTASVAAGVPVDNTVGTAALSIADIAAVTGAQIAAATTSP